MASSKFERDLLLPAFELVQRAHKLEEEAGTSYRLGFDPTHADEAFCSFLMSWSDPKRAAQRESWTLIHAMLRWYDGGCPRFRLSHGLTTELSLTDPSGVPMEEVRQPFPTYLVELPRSGSPITWSSHHAGDAEPAYLFVHTIVGAGPIGAPSKAPASEWMEMFARHRQPDGPRSLNVCIFSTVKAPHSFLARSDVLDTPVVTVRPAPRASDPERAPFDDDEGAMTMAWRLAFNIPLYLRHHPSGTIGGGKTVNHDHGIRSVLYEIGADVPLNRELRDAARAACRGDEKKWSLAKRFIVRGHWKQQAFGPGRVDRKLIFVEPYWKGPAESPLVARAHVDKRA